MAAYKNGGMSRGNGIPLLSGSTHNNALHRAAGGVPHHGQTHGHNQNQYQNHMAPLTNNQSPSHDDADAASSLLGFFSHCKQEQRDSFQVKHEKDNESTSHEFNHVEPLPLPLPLGLGVPLGLQQRLGLAPLVVGTTEQQKPSLPFIFDADESMSPPEETVIAPSSEEEEEAGVSDSAPVPAPVPVPVPVDGSDPVAVAVDGPVAVAIAVLPNVVLAVDSSSSDDQQT